MIDKLAHFSKLMGGDRTSTIDQLDVTILREELGEANLELGGGREILINRLNVHRQGQVHNREEEFDDLFLFEY